MQDVYEAQIAEFIREILAIEGAELKARASQNVFPALKDAQVFAWEAFCREHGLSDAARHQVKKSVFDEVARRAALAALSQAWTGFR